MKTFLTLLSLSLFFFGSTLGSRRKIKQANRIQAMMAAQPKKTVRRNLNNNNKVAHVEFAISVQPTTNGLDKNVCTRERCSRRASLGLGNYMSLFELLPKQEDAAKFSKNMVQQKDEKK